MAIQIYKAAQGRYVRIGTAVVGGIVDLAVCYYLYYLLDRNLEGVAYKTYLTWAIPAAVFVGLGLVAFRYLNKPVVVDFLVATESEMKKVSWPGKAELWGSTAVVVVTVVLLAALIFVWDWLFAGFLDWVGCW